VTETACSKPRIYLKRYKRLNNRCNDIIKSEFEKSCFVQAQVRTKTLETFGKRYNV